jgi:hypothetical protein
VNRIAAVSSRPGSVSTMTRVGAMVHSTLSYAG